MLLLRFLYTTVEFGVPVLMTDTLGNDENASRIILILDSPQLLVMRPEKSLLWVVLPKEGLDQN